MILPPSDEELTIWFIANAGTLELELNRIEYPDPLELSAIPAHTSPEDALEGLVIEALGVALINQGDKSLS